MRQISVYVASKRRHAERIKAARLDGIHLNARWLDTANLPANAAKPSAHWQRENFNDIRDAEAVLVYGEKGEQLVNALVEVGYAIAHGKRVYCVGSLDGEGNVFFHPDYEPWRRSDPGMIQSAESFKHAFALIRGVAVVEPGLTEEQKAMAWRNGNLGISNMEKTDAKG